MREIMKKDNVNLLPYIFGLGLFVFVVIISFAFDFGRNKVVPVDKLALASGDIEFAFTDDNKDETFIIKTDKKDYVENLSGATVYFSVTNLRDAEEGWIKFAFERKEELVKLQVLEGEEEWKDIELVDYTEHTNKKQKSVGDRIIKNQAKYNFPKGTIFFKAQIDYPFGTDSEFFIEVYGADKGYGHLDPLINTDWNRRVALEINSDYVSGSGSLSNFPVLLTEDNFPSEMFDADGSYPALSSGCDLRFSTDANGDIELSLEIVNFTTDNDPSNGEAEIWVNVSSVSATATTTIYAWYNNSSASCYAEGDTFGSENVWTNNYVAVYHMNNLTSSTIKDSTSNDYNGAKGFSGQPTEISSGKINDAQDFDGASDFIDISGIGGSTGSWTTMSGWIKPNATSQSGAIGGHMRNFYWNDYGKGFQYINGEVYAMGEENNDNEKLSASLTDTSNWHFIAGEFDADGKLFLDDTLSDTGNISTSWPYQFAFGCARKQYDEVYHCYNGGLDEVHISNTSRSNDWHATVYNNQNNPTNFTIEQTASFAFNYLANWNNSKKITIDHTKVSGSSNLTNFPVLLSENNFDVSVYSLSKDSGADMRFSSDSGGAEPLAFEIVNWDKENRIAEVWVKVPTVYYDRDTVFYVWYNNSSASALASDNEYGSENVWDDNYVLVQHLNEDTGNGTSRFDSTSNNIDFTVTDITNSSADGVMGKGDDFESSNTDYIQVGDTNTLDLTTFTTQVWYKPESISSQAMPIFEKREIGQNNYYMNWEIETFNSNAIYAAHASGGPSMDWLTYTGISAGNWYSIVFTQDNTGNAQELWVNGISRDSDNSSLVPYTSGTHQTTIGRHENAARYADGIIDEIRVSDIVRSDSWIETEYANQNSPSTFTTMSPVITNIGEGATSITTGPIAYWRMDEKAGTTAYDVSGNEYDGTLTNMDASTDWVRGKYGSALNFDGVDDSVDITGGITLEGDVSVEGWAYFNNSGTSEYVFSGCNDPNSACDGVDYDYISLRKDADDKLLFGLGWIRSGSGYCYYTTTNTVPIGEWVNMAARFDPNDNDNGVKLYINGKEEARIRTCSSPSPTAITLYPAIGAMAYGNNTISGHQGYINGKVDNVKIYDYLLTQEQVIESMNAGRPATAENSTVGYWKFDEGYGDTANDSSGNSYNATRYNASWTSDGKYGKALNFDGIGDYLSLAHISVLDFGLPDDKYTLSAWIKTSASSGYVISKDRLSSVDMPMIFGINSGRVRFWAWDQTEGHAEFLLDGNISINDDQWHQILAVYNGASERKIYVDGELDTTDTSTVTSDIRNTDPISLGRWRDNNNYYYFNGIIDDVKIYNYALSADQIKKDYNQRSRSMVLSTPATASDGTTIDSSSAREYCVPGDTSTCNPPIAHWKFDEKEGITAYDISGNGYNGTLTGGPTWTRGKYGSALDFDGSDDFVLTTDIDTLGNFTYEAYVKIDQLGSTMFIFDKEIGGSLWPSVRLYVNAGGTVSFDFYRNTSTQQLVTSVSTLTVGQYYHLAGTYNGSNLKIYIDGKLDNSALASGAPNNINNELAIGAHENNVAPIWSSLFNGIIDEAKIYDYERTPAQIVWDYNYGKPVAHWKMDANTGTTAYDSSGNGNNGTLTNMDAGTDWVSGKTKYALDLDGSDDYVIDSSTEGLPTSAPFSISAWIKPENLDGFQSDTVIQIGDYANSFELMTVWEDDKMRFFQRNGDNLNGQTDMIEDQWHHVIIVVDASNNGYLYLDGKLDNSSSGMSMSSPITNEVRIGVEEAGDNNLTYYFNGQIDDVRVYNYNLTYEQVKQAYNEGAGMRFD